MIIIETNQMGFGDSAFDTTILQNSVEAAHLIIKGKIKALADVDFNDPSDLPAFLYDVEIEEVYYDRENKYKTDDVIKFYTLCGYLKANDYLKAVGNRPRAQKYKYLKDSYADNEYIRFLDFGEMAYEVGKEYILMLYCPVSEYNPNKYNGPASCTHLYEIDGDRVTNTYKEKAEKKLSELVKEIKECVINRTGKYDKYYNGK